MSFRYVAFGWEVESDVPFASLAPLPLAIAPSANSLSPLLTPVLTPSFSSKIRLRQRSSSFQEPERWLYSERFEATDELWRAVGVYRDGYLIRLFGFADFFLQKGSIEAHFVLAAGAPIEAIEPLFLEQVLPLWWSLLGRPCLHASAIVWPNSKQIVAFAGPSGSGKSTLATALAGDGGFVSDDCVVLDLLENKVIAHPGPRAVRLLSDTASALLHDANAGALSADGAKRRVLVQASNEALPVAKMYFLGEPPNAPSEHSFGSPHVEPLRLREVMRRLTGCYFRLDPEDGARLSDELETLTQIASRVSASALYVPKVFSALEQTRAVIQADLAQTAEHKSGN